MGTRALIERIRARSLPLRVVVLGHDADVATAVELVRAGAAEYVEPPGAAAAAACGGPECTRGARDLTRAAASIRGSVPPEAGASTCRTKCDPRWCAAAAAPTMDADLMSPNEEVR